MAAGLGFKDFVTGEVLTAADVDGYLMQGIWVFANATARDAAVTSPQEGNACYLKDTDQVLTYSGSAWVAVGGQANDTARVATFQSTTSTSYTDLATSGPAVTVTTGTKALVIVSARIMNNTNNNSLQAFMSYAVSGATTTAASDNVALAVSGINSVNYQFKMSCASIATLTAGSNTFTAKYRNVSGTSEFADREILVINLN
jgi:hypothetical protein